ncbi:MAG TPA: fasciclin domain-containing protein, partial [Gemmatimonas sp.]|nr:fasciclin domain-containing protein [Gemmatimonas sp.]
FTVFAPTDEAFAKLPAGTVDALLADIPQLTKILTYHVVSGTVKAADVLKLDGQSVATVNGATVAIGAKDGVSLNGTANVTQADVECTNGVIHIIDTVILPPA